MSNQIVLYNNFLQSSTSKALTTQDIMLRKGKQKICMLTCYDYSFANLLDASGVDILLVGDSLGMVVLGNKDTVDVSLDVMIHHTKAVVKGTNRALVVADMPFMTYEQNIETAMTNAKRLVQESGARAVKLEGGKEIVPQVKSLVTAGIAVVGHIGLTPQRVSTLGGFKVQARTASAAKKLLEDALALQEAGCFAIVLEAIPSSVASYITSRINIPTIGIGAGSSCDGQVLVLHDMLGLNMGHVPKFVKKYADVGNLVCDAVRSYIEDVNSGSFPTAEHSFKMPEEEELSLK